MTLVGTAREDCERGRLSASPRTHEAGVCRCTRRSRGGGQELQGGRRAGVYIGS